jgi:hypothetical protein
VFVPGHPAGIDLEVTAMRVRYSAKVVGSVAVLFLATYLPAQAASFGLPEAAAKVIKANFPDATITSVGRERERGAWYYEVTLKEAGGRRFEVEVTEAGVLGEIEGVVRLNDLPDELVKVVRERVGGGRITRVEKHERRGIARNGQFVALPEPRLSYEIKYVDAAGARREFQVASNQVLELPDEVRK